MKTNNVLFRERIRRLRIFQLLLITLLVCGFHRQLGAQTPPYQATATQEGFILTKVESNTSVNSGQTFTYTLNFTIPNGGSSVTITDQLPSNLEFISSTYSTSCPAPVTVSAPPVNSMGGTYALTIPTPTSGCNGTISITVRFPNGTTCNGTTARNRVCMTGRLNERQVEFCTEFVSVTAVAVNPWHINKYVSGAAWVGGSCPYATGDSIVTYQIQVYKDVGTTGQLNLVNGVVYDTLPPGAVLLSSTCGATQSGNVITWNVGNQSATSMFNWQTCNFVIYYPTALFPTGTNVVNRATLSGSLGSSKAPCGNINMTSNQTCVQLLPVTQAQFSKFVYTNGQPGCASRYLIYICNNGNTTLTSFTATDPLPTGITGVSIGTVSAGLTATLSGGTVTINSTSPLAPGQCRYVEILFTIPTSATIGSVIQNCATLTSTTTPAQFPPKQACATFTVTAPVAKPCVWKEVCNKQTSYLPGATVRYRLRVQNIGGQPITGATITDVLNSNLVYMGNPAFYTSNSWNIACGTGTPWTGVTMNYNSTSNTVTATLPTIGASCQNFFYSNCGQYGTSGVPFYFIEFDVKVLNTSALGNIPNAFTIGGGSVTTPVTSNTDYITVVGTTAFGVEKAVRPSNASTPYAPTAMSSPGANIDYRLRLNILPTATAAMRYITFADELPRNAGVNDRLILNPCTPRGSQFDVEYASLISTSSPVSQYNRGFAPDVNVNALTLPVVGASFAPNGCGTDLAAWPLGTILPGYKNLAYHFGATPLAGSVTAEFQAKVSSSAKANESACNTFAATGYLAHLINSTTLYLSNVSKLESPTACVRITDEPPTDCCDYFFKGVKVDKVWRAGVSGGDDNIMMAMTFAPSRPIRKMTMTIVSASKRNTSPFPGPWQRIYGDIKSATAIPGLGSSYLGGQAPSTSYVAPTFKTREVEWGTNAAGNAGPFNATIGLAFPVPPNYPYADDLNYFLRITMTDTNCVRCDTLIFIPVKKRYVISKWIDTPIATLTMNSDRDGRLTVQTPPNVSGDPEDQIRVVAVGFKANDATVVTGFDPATDNFRNAEPEEDIMYCEGMMTNGESASFDVVFNNPLAETWSNTLVIKYQVGESDEVMTDYINITAAAPVYQGGDILVETDSEASNVRTYALWFENANSANHSIANVELRMPEGIRLLAFGSGLTNNQKLEATAQLNSDGTKIESYLIPVQGADRQRIPLYPGKGVGPVYITVSGGETGFDMGFTTTDENGVVITQGSVWLENPVYRVKDKNEGDEGEMTGVSTDEENTPGRGPSENPAIMLNVYPNPAGNSATVNLGLEDSEVLSVVVIDGQGKEVTRILNENTLLTGNHIFSLNTSHLLNGTYYIMAKTRDGRITTSVLKVVK